MQKIVAVQDGVSKKRKLNDDIKIQIDDIRPKKKRPEILKCPSDIQNVLALVSKHKNDHNFGLALEVLLKAEKKFSMSSTLLTKVARLYAYYFKNYEKAVIYFEKALHVIVEKKAESKFVLSIYWQYHNYLISVDKKEDAKQVASNLIQIYTDIFSKTHSKDAAIVLFNLEDRSALDIILKEFYKSYYDIQAMANTDGQKEDLKLWDRVSEIYNEIRPLVELSGDLPDSIKREMEKSAEKTLQNNNEAFRKSN